MKKSILVIGSLNMDLSVNLERIPAVGETVLGKDLSSEAGGKGANQACAAGRLGADIWMLGCVGQDEFGKKQLESLREAGVKADRLKITQEQTTGTAIIYVDSLGSNNIVVIPGANEECDTAYLEDQAELFDRCDYVVLQMEIPYESVEFAARKAKEAGKTVILNPAPTPDAIPEELYRLVDYLTPNETELMKLSRVEDTSLDCMKRGARRLLEKGAGCVIVTLGDRGSLLVREKECLYPARKVEAVDTTAAGDCFNGAFAAALAEGLSEGDAVLFANTAASIAVTRKGASESLPVRTEVEACLAGGRQENK